LTVSGINNYQIRALSTTSFSHARRCSLLLLQVHIYRSFLSVFGVTTMNGSAAYALVAKNCTDSTLIVTGSIA